MGGSVERSQSGAPWIQRTAARSVGGMPVRISLPTTMYDSYIMRRTQIYLDADQSEQLGRRARASGVSRSTVIREAIASYLSSPEESDELARFRAAIDAVGEHPIDLPDGETYVEAIRAADADRDAALDARRERRKRRQP